MKHLLEYLPLAAFFISYYLFDVYIATAVLIGATVLQLIALQVIFKKIERQNWIVFGVVSVFGALTLYFHDDNFIKLKPSIIYGVFALVLLGYQLVGQSIPQKLMGSEIDAPSHVWRNLSFGWAATCVIAGVLNFWIAFNLSLDTWVNFKVFGLTALTFIMFICSGVYIYKYMPSDDAQQ
ncbi:MAG: septation protein A [Psychrobium sp.]